NAISARFLGRQALRTNSQESTGHVAVGNELVHHVLGSAGGDRESDSHAAAARRLDGYVDSDHTAANVNQCSAGVARVDRRVGLEQIPVSSGLLTPADKLLARSAADDSQGHG